MLECVLRFSDGKRGKLGKQGGAIILIAQDVAIATAHQAVSLHNKNIRLFNAQFRHIADVIQVLPDYFYDFAIFKLAKRVNTEVAQFNCDEPNNNPYLLHGFPNYKGNEYDALPVTVGERSKFPQNVEYLYSRKMMMRLRGNDPGGFSGGAIVDIRNQVLGMHVFSKPRNPNTYDRVLTHGVALTSSTILRLLAEKGINI